MLTEKKSKRSAFRITAFIIITAAVATLEVYGIDVEKEGSLKYKREDEDNSIISKFENLFDDISADFDLLLHPEKEIERNPKKRLSEPSAAINETKRSMDKTQIGWSSKPETDKNKDKQHRVFFRFFSDDKPARKYRHPIASKGGKSDKIASDNAFPSELIHLFPEIGLFRPAAQIFGRSFNDDGNRSRWDRNNGVMSRRPQCHCSISVGKFADEREKRRDAFDSEQMIPRLPFLYRSDPEEEIFQDTKYMLDDIFENVFKMMPFSLMDEVVDEPTVIKIGSSDSGKMKYLRDGKINVNRSNLHSFIENVRSKRQGVGDSFSPRLHVKDYISVLKGLGGDKSGKDHNKRRVKKESNLAPSAVTANHTLSTHGAENNVTDFKNNTTLVHHSNSTISINTMSSKSTMEVNNLTEIIYRNPDNITTAVIEKEKSKIPLLEEIEISVYNLSVSGLNNTENVNPDNKTLVTMIISLEEQLSSEANLRKGYNFNKTNISSDLINLFDEMNNYDEPSAFQVSQSAAEIKPRMEGKSKDSDERNVFLIVLGIIPGIVGLVVVIGIVIIWVLQKRPSWISAASGIGSSRNESGIPMSQIPSLQQQPKSSIQC